MPSKRESALGSPLRTNGTSRPLVANGHAAHSLRDAHHHQQGQNSRIPAIHYSPASSPSIANGADRDFPPTPPSCSRESMARPSKHAPNGNPVKSAKPLPTRSSKDHRSPPTPETTPPASLSPPQRQIPSRLSSSAADSFQTAREEPWQSNDNLSSIDGTVSNDLRRPASQLSHLGLGFENDVDRTPRQSVENLPHAVTKTSPGRNSMDHIPDREWDTNLMRNVTIRRRRDPEILTNGITPHAVTDNHSSSTARSSLDSPRTPDAAEIRRNFLRRVSPESPEDLGNRRHSAISTSSTVIEAMIVTTPPQRPRKLRHVSKASSLRSEIDTNSFDSPAASSARDSLESTEMPSHRLPQNRSISDGRMQPLTPQRDRRIRVTDPLLRHHKDTASLRADAQWPLGAPRSRVASQSVDETVPGNASGSYHRRAVSDMPAISSPRKRINYESPSKRISYESEASSDVPYSNRAPQTPQRTELSKNQSSFNATRHATQRALENIVPAFSPKSSTNESLVTVVRKRSGASIDRVNGLPTEDDRWLRPKESRRASDGSGRSVDRAEFSTRLSVDRATLRSEDHPRHLYSQTTPFSQTSDVPEVSEATAVNIYPHNNHSLLVVQHPKLGRLAAEEIEQQHNAPPPDQPLLTFQPSTPPSKPAELVENSPLTNPRNAPLPPLPPIINVLPATPAHDEGDEGPNAEGIQRRPSLLQRARRYSDNIIQPILKRSTSLRRQNSHRTARNSEAERLHPNWHPRDFWENNSDSESDFGDGAAGGDDNYDPLPPGGDTSNPSLPRRLTQRLPGFRGTGGFLIGNSLGVTRHGTNKRRHHVTLPADFRAPRGGVEGGSAGTGTSSSVSASASSSDAHRVRKKQSLGSLRAASARQQRQAQRRWRTMGVTIEYIGIRGMRERWRQRQLRQHERRREKQREEIRRSIGPKFLVENGAVGRWN